MVSREIPQGNWNGELTGQSTLYHRYPLGDNILSKYEYKNLYKGDDLQDVPDEEGTDFVVIVDEQEQETYYMKEDGQWVQIALGPIPIRYYNIYTKEEFDYLLANLVFDGTYYTWSHLNSDTKAAYLVGKVRR